MHLYIDKIYKTTECTGLDTQGVRMHNPDNRAPWTSDSRALVSKVRFILHQINEERILLSEHAKTYLLMYFFYSNQYVEGVETYAWLRNVNKDHTADHVHAVAIRLIAFSGLDLRYCEDIFAQGAR